MNVRIISIKTRRASGAAAVLAIVLAAVFTTVFAAAAAAQNASAAAAGNITVLDSNSYFRWRRQTAPIVFADASGPCAAPADFDKRKPALSPDPDNVPLSDDWASEAFDDSAWNRVQFGDAKVTDGQAVMLGSSAVYLRARFEVTDPAAIHQLSLPELRFYGGIIVYLNGQEIARADLPAGKLDAAAQATAYPDDAWLMADGRAISAEKTHLSKEAAAGLATRQASRTRKLGPIDIPLHLLRKGVNVLAIELRRSPSHPKGWKNWQPIGLEAKSILLQASADSGIVANISRPKGFHVWVEDINDRIGVRDWADPCEPVGPMRIVGARNGSFGGIIVLSSTSPLKGISVKVSDLKAVKGEATIASSAAELFSEQPDGQSYMMTDWFDGLSPGVPQDSPALQIKPWNQKPIDDAAMRPVFVRFNIPKDAAPGDYKGTIDIHVEGASPVSVPVEAYISPWTAPDPKDYRTYVGLYESPTSVALQYHVPMWSEEHWKLLDKSFALLARAGNRMINVCIVDKTQFGNDEGILYWIRKPDGTYDYDFTNFDRLVALAKKHFGSMDYVALQIWHSGGWETRAANQENTVTVVDSATGKHQAVQVPPFDSDEARKFWKPVLEQCREHLAKVGLEKSMCIGILSDGTAPPAVFKMFDDIWPGGGPARWTRGLHGQREDTKPYRASPGGGIVVLHEHCYGSPMLTVGDPLTGLSKLRGVPVTAYFRFSGFETLCTVNGYRLLTDNAIFLRKQGIGRIGFDFWDVLPPRPQDDNQRNIYNRYPFSSCAQRAPALFKLSWPGPDGALTTQRFEVLCQGVRETEAMLAVSAALDKGGGGLNPEAQAACRKVLYDHLWFVNTRPIESVTWGTMENHVNHCGWQDLVRRTFDCAADADAVDAAAAKAQH